MTVKIKIGNVKSRIYNLLNMGCIDALSLQLSYTTDEVFYSWKAKYGGWDGRTRLLTSKQEFPTGCLDRACSVLSAWKIEYELEDTRTFVEPNQGLEWHGFEPYGYQREAIETAIGKKSGMLKMATGAGKAQPLDSKVLTPYGWTTMGELKVGFEVIGGDGKVTLVTNVYPQGEKDIYKISFTDGTSTECCKEHLWKVQDASTRDLNLKDEEWKVKTLKEISESVSIGQNRLNYKIPMCEPIDFKEKKLYIDPYVMGILLSSGGSIPHLQISVANREIANEIRELVFGTECVLKKVNSDCEKYLITLLTEKDRQGGNLIPDNVSDYDPFGLISSSEFIPNKYLFGSIKDRISFLQGLMDIDGVISDNGNVVYTTTSKRFSDDFQFLIQSLGGTAKSSSEHDDVGHKYVRNGEPISYTVTIALRDNIIPFRLSSKADRVKNRVNYSPKRYISNVEKVGRKKAQCISVSNTDQLYITNDCIITHNSLSLSNLVMRYNTTTVIYVISLDLLNQMHDQLINDLKIPIGIVGDGKCDIQQITICSAWTAGKAFSKKKIKSSEDIKVDKWTPSQKQKHDIKEMVRNANLAILDEAQFAAADSIKIIFNNSINAANRFGLSGTPWRGDGTGILLEAAFGNEIVDISASQLIDMGYLVPAHIVVKDVPKPTTTIQKSWMTVKSEYIVNNIIRNDMIISEALKLLKHGRKPLILFKEHKHGKILEALLPEDINYRYITGKQSSDERAKIRQEFLDGKVDLILASSIFDQGINLPALDALIITDGGKSTGKCLQRIGRVIRSYPGKKDALIIDFFDQCHYVNKHTLARYNICKTESKFKIKVEKAFQAYLKKKKKY